MKKRSYFISVLMVPALAAFGSAAWAAENPQDQAKSQIASQTQLFRAEAQKKAETLSEKPVIHAPEAKKPSPEAGPAFFIQRIELEGNTVFPGAVFDPFLKRYENRKDSAQDLNNLCDLVTNYYRARGYLTSYAYLPPQKIADGVVRIRVVEASIGHVKVAGNRYFKDAIYRDGLGIKTDAPFQANDLEKGLYFLNQKPDLSAQADLVAGEKPGTSDIVLNAHETNPLHAYYAFNNHGTKYTNLGRHEFHVEDNNLSGRGDTLSVVYSTAAEGAFSAGSFLWTLPVDRTGTTFMISGSGVETLAVRELKPLEIKGKSLSLSPEIHQLLVKSVPMTVEAVAGFDFVDSKTLVDGEKQNFDRMRIVRLGPHFTFVDAGGKSFVSGDAHWGIPDFLGGLGEDDIHASSFESGGAFLYYTGSAARIQRLPAFAHLPDGMFLILRGSGQWTRDSLTSSETFHAGGAYSVRGYPEADATGDYGWTGTAEWYIPAKVPSIGEMPLPFRKDKKIKDTVKFVLFTDAGKTYLREKSADTTALDKFLLGSGIGIRVNVEDNISFQADLGWPLGDPSTDKNQKQVHVEAKIGF